MKEYEELMDKAYCAHSYDDIVSRIETLGQEISRVHKANTPVFLCVMKGGLVFSGHLLTTLNFPLHVDYCQTARYFDDIVEDDVQWLVEPSICLKGRHIIVVDDILDIGSSLEYVVNFCERKGCASVTTVVLTEKIHERKANPDFKADFVGFYLPDQFVFGFGMDCRSLGRNAKGIFLCEASAYE